MPDFSTLTDAVALIGDVILLVFWAAVALSALALADMGVRKVIRLIRGA